MSLERVLFINIIKQCNMHCDRCYLTESSRRNAQILPFLAIEKILKSSWAQDCSLTIIWEGGEAALAGRHFFGEMVKQTKRLRPDAKQTMVSNLYSLPDWLIRLSQDYFESKIETTFSLGGKFSLSKNQSMFLTRFAKNFLKASNAGLLCPINLELNDHTVKLGSRRLVDYLAGLGKCQIEFDVSVDFERFLADPAYTLHGYPILPLTTSYANFARFVSTFDQEIRARGLELKIGSSLIDEMREKKQSSMFGIQRGSDFLTINPDGSLTTNPLFSDLVPTFLGNVLKDDIEMLLESPKRTRFIRHEIRKTAECMSCEFYSLCSGGPSHAPTFDGSGECAGMKQLRIELQGV